MWARQLLSVAILPFTITVVIPAWIARSYDIGLRVGGTPAHVAVQILGLGVLAVGVALFAASLRQFAVRGKGTLAPWDPPTHLVIEGPYRFVRNPMISGVVFILVGEALILLSPP